MNLPKLLKILFGGMSVIMVALVMVTSMRSNLFEVWDELSKQPWMVTTLWDFYFNITILAVWVIYKEAQWLKAIGWIIAFICLGSIATCFYVFKELCLLKKGESLEKVLLKRR